jgi:hypothetical protein
LVLLAATPYTLSEGLLLLRALATTKWVATSGRVLTAHVVSFAAGRGCSYAPLVEYEYHVGGNKYEGKTVGYSGRHIGSEQALEAVEQFRAMKTVPVWYDPKHPQRSVLDPGPDKWNYITTGIGLLFMVAGLDLILLS